MSKIALTKSLSVEDGSHILYFYNTDEAYMENVMSFILTGLNLGQHVIYIDRPDRYNRVLQTLSSRKDLDNLYFINGYEFYETHHDFNYDRILSKLDTIIEPYIKDETVVRMWGHVEVLKQADIREQLHTYEAISDITIAEVGYTTVCCYDAEAVPASIYVDLMKAHQYFMTDDQLVRSTLYKSSNGKNPTVVFPSLSIQHEFESEMDLYKQKLDFVHVVSHEVRNPLTVIKAYASLLFEDETDENRREKLQNIMNYATAIDNEISHIISTEEMLTTDAVWRKSLTKVQPTIATAVEMMRVKALTQNISLQSHVKLDGTEILLANSIGIRLILTNLLSNAIKYSAEGQTVWLSISKDNHTLCICVTDEGIGMHPEQQDRLFTKYEKMNHETSGQGIGLFMVKQLVDHFHGDIEVTSEYGTGSTFTVHLPLRKSQSVIDDPIVIPGDLATS